MHRYISVSKKTKRKGEIMTEEINQETKSSQWSISPDFAKFLLTILATFIGCLIALCLFSAVTRPQGKPCCYPPPRFEAPMYHHRGEFRPHKPYKHHKIDAPRKEFKAPAPKAPKEDKK